MAYGGGHQGFTLFGAWNWYKLIKKEKLQPKCFPGHGKFANPPGVPGQDINLLPCLGSEIGTIDLIKNDLPPNYARAARFRV